MVAELLLSLIRGVGAGSGFQVGICCLCWFRGREEGGIAHTGIHDPHPKAVQDLPLLHKAIGEIFDNNNHNCYRLYVTRPIYPLFVRQMGHQRSRGVGFFAFVYSWS